MSQEVGPAIFDIATEAVTLVPTSSIADTGLTREIVDISVPTSLYLVFLNVVDMSRVNLIQ